MRLRIPALATVALVASIHAAVAQPGPAVPDPAPPGADQPAAPETSDQPSGAAPSPSITSSFRNPDPGGIRATLGRYGIALGATYIGEALGNVSGGVKRSSIYEGRLDLQFDADLEKLAGLPGLTVHANAYQIHGRGLSGCCVRNFTTASGIEATPSTRLFELWAEQTVFDGKLAVRIGQLAADTEFLVSQYAGLFVNATFGFPTITAADLPSGGPAYPLATPGIRVKVMPTEDITVLAAVFDGDPAGPGSNDPQRRNASGTRFRTSDSPLVMAEVAYSYNRGKGPGLPGTVKLGGWQHFGRFNDQQFGTDGLSLVDPNGTGIPRRTSGSGGIYAVIDQLVYREPGTVDQGLGAFARVSGSPASDSLVSFYADGGLTYKGLVPGRVNDTAGISAAYVQVSPTVRKLDRDQSRFGEAGYPIRSSEVLIAASYQAEVISGFTIQPEVQYVIRPGGNVPNPRDPGKTIGNATIVGLRATIRY